MNLENLKTLAKDLPTPYKENAEALIERMEAVVEGIGDEVIKWRIPLAKLLQPTSDRSKLPKGVAAGDILIGEEKQEQPLAVIPLRTGNIRQYWSPDQNEAKMLCSSPDAKLGYIGVNCNDCPHSKFNEETRKSECSKVKQVIVIKEDLSDIFMLNFAKTNYAIGTEWEGMMKKAGVAPYRRVYSLSAETNKKYKTIESFVVETRTGDAKAPNDAVVPFLTELFNIIGVERKESLDKFYEIVQARKQDNPALTNSSSADNEVVLIEDNSSTSESGLASKYSV
ncbi:hypothetical protein D3C87_279500 [compost metagenome]